LRKKNRKRLRMKHLLYMLMAREFYSRMLPGKVWMKFWIMRRTPFSSGFSN
jgi:hypothetical protein